MPTFDDTIIKLRGMFLKDAKIKEDLRTDPRDQVALDLEQVIEKHIRSELISLLQHPPHLAMNPETMPKFFEVGPYQESVFIMTKFPESNAADDPLNRIITAVKNSITKCNHCPRIASDPPRYSEKLWDNVVVHLLGCAKGVAIVENKYKDELNPNVTLEWGWMRAMGKDVLYLREKEFSKERADLMGFIADTFDWNDPTTIEPLIEKWLLSGRKK